MVSSCHHPWPRHKHRVGAVVVAAACRERLKQGHTQPLCMPTLISQGQLGQAVGSCRAEAMIQTHVPGEMLTIRKRVHSQEKAELALRGAAILTRLLLVVMDKAAPAALLEAASMLHDNALLVRNSASSHDQRRAVTSRRLRNCAVAYYKGLSLNCPPARLERLFDPLQSRPADVLPVNSKTHTVCLSARTGTI